MLEFNVNGVDLQADTSNVDWLETYQKETLKIQATLNGLQKKGGIAALKLTLNTICSFLDSLFNKDEISKLLSEADRKDILKVSEVYGAVNKEITANIKELGTMTVDNLAINKE